MRLLKLLFLTLAIISFFTPLQTATAADFDWLKNMNLSAEADRSGFIARLYTRFNIGDAQVRVVLSNVERLSDAYMVLRLGEMSSRSPSRVLDKYAFAKNKGWGVLAKNLGIKPGSKEFKALKRGSDLWDIADNPKTNVPKNNKHGKNKGKK